MIYIYMYIIYCVTIYESWIFVYTKFYVTISSVFLYFGFL